VGEESYLVEDLSLPCSGPAYRAASAFNAMFVLLVVCGWPCFLVWYLRRLKHRGVTEKESVIDRVGFLFSKYKPDHIYHDVIETVRKLYLVTLVAFFAKGSMVQIVGSLFISVVAFGHHVYALPFMDPTLNMLQGACLFMIWLTLQAGMMLVATAPDNATGNGVLIVASIANIVIMVSPAMLIALLFVKAIPKSIRRRVSTAFGLKDPALTQDLEDENDDGSDPQHRSRTESEDNWMQSDSTNSTRTSPDGSDNDDDDEKRPAEPAPVPPTIRTSESTRDASMVEMVEIATNDGGLLKPTKGELRAVSCAEVDVLQNSIGIMKSNPLAGAQLLTVAPLEESAGTTLVSVMQSLPTDSAAVVRRALAQRDAEIRERDAAIRQRDAEIRDRDFKIHERDAENQALKQENVHLRRQYESVALLSAESASLPPVLVPVVQGEQLWDEYRDQEGSTYYHHRVTGETTWSKPE
jgi:hypothetical protein